MKFYRFVFRERSYRFVFRERSYRFVFRERITLGLYNYLKAKKLF